MAMVVDGCLLWVLFFGSSQTVALAAPLHSSHAAELLARAADDRTRGDEDKAIALEWRFLRVASRIEGEQSAKTWTVEEESQVRERVSATYLALGHELLEHGRLIGAARAHRMAAAIDAGGDRPRELEAAIQEVARAAYLRAYAISRDGGAESLSDARKLLRFAAGATTADSRLGRKIRARLSEIE